MIERRHIAIHEAGHVVAHIRLGILQDQVTVVPKDGRAGAATAEGSRNVWSADEAGPMVLAYCAGYAAMAAAGCPEEVAVQGCGDDFEEAESLIEQWGLDGTLEQWKARAVEMMRAPENVRAVRIVAEHLLEYETLDADYLERVLELADGKCTEPEFRQYLQFRKP